MLILNVTYAERFLCWMFLMLNVSYAERFLCWMFLMLNISYAEHFLCWTFLMLNISYAECFLCWTFLMLNICYAEHFLCWTSLWKLSYMVCHYAQCRIFAMLSLGWMSWHRNHISPQKEMLAIIEKIMEGSYWFFFHTGLWFDMAKYLANR